MIYFFLIKDAYVGYPVYMSVRALHITYIIICVKLFLK